MLRRNIHQGCRFQLLRQLIGDFVDGLLSLYLPRLRSRPGIFSIGDRASMPKLPVQVAVFFRCAAHVPIILSSRFDTLKALWLLPRDI